MTMALAGGTRNIAGMIEMVSESTTMIRHIIRTATRIGTVAMIKARVSQPTNESFLYYSYDIPTG